MNVATPSLRFFYQLTWPLMKIVAAAALVGWALGSPAAAAVTGGVLVAAIWTWRNHVLPARVPSVLAGDGLGETAHGGDGRPAVASIANHVRRVERMGLLSRFRRQ